MSMHTRLLFLGLLASLGGAGQAADSPFSLGSDSGLQIAVRLISDKAPEEPSSDGSIEEEDAESPEQAEEGAHLPHKLPASRPHRRTAPKIKAFWRAQKKDHRLQGRKQPVKPKIPGSKTDSKENRNLRNRQVSKKGKRGIFPESRPC